MARGLIGWGGKGGGGACFCMYCVDGKGQGMAWHGMAWHGTNSAPAFWMFSTNGWERGARDLESDAPAGRSDHVSCLLPTTVSQQ